MIRSMTQFLFVYLLASISAHWVQADTIFDNDLNLADANFASISMTSTTTGVQFQVADDFSFSGNSQRAIDGARWTGIILDEQSFQATIGETFVFDLLVFADSGQGHPTGTPLDPIPGTAIAARQVTATGTDTGVFTSGAEFQASFAPIVLEANTNYWLTIAARGNFDFQELANPDGLAWAWIGRSGTGNAWQGGTDFQSNWFFQGRQQDFSLSGHVIPEPSGFFLLPGLVAALACRRRMRHYTTR